MSSRVMFISGRPDDARLLARMLRPLPLALDHVQTLQQARNLLNQKHYDVILTESSVADGNWLDVVHVVRDAYFQSEVIVTDRAADAQFWAEAMNLGAYDLLAQPFYEPEVRRILGNACSRSLHRPVPATAV
jgi:DNA-binding NtrC family response regulator